MAQFSPRNQMEVNLLELLAADFVRLGRIGQCRESLMNPARVAEGTCNWPDPDEHTQRIQLFEDLTRRIEEGLPLHLTGDNLEIASADMECVLDMLWNVQDEHDKAKAEGRSDVLERLAEDLALYRTIKPRSLGLRAPKGVSAFLTGQREMRAEHRPRWVCLINVLLRGQRSRLASTPHRDQEAEAKCRRYRIGMTDRLPTLDAVDRYDARARGMIAKTLRLLMTLRRGSAIQE